MTTTTTAQHSLWLEAMPETGYPTVTGDAAFDVAVVGGGLTGLTTALLLKRAGLRVAVIEADRVGAGVSGNNTAKVTALQATVYSALTCQHGVAAAADYADASLAGVDLVARLANQESIDCDLARRPAYTYAISQDERPAVRAEAEAARQAGLPVTFEDPGEVDLPFPVHGAVRLSDQIVLHPLKYALGIAAAVHGDQGCQVFEHSRVHQVKEGSPCRVMTSGGVITADRVVVATHYPILDRGVFFARLEATRAYCIAVRLRNGSPPRGLSINAGSPTWSVSSAGELMILAGQSHPTGQRRPSQGAFDRLVAFARQHWDLAQVTHRWSAQDPTAYDQLPMIGTYRPGTHRLYVATGFRKWGLATSAVAARILTDLLTDLPSPWASRFSPHRLSLRGTPRLAMLNARAAVDFVGDRLRPAPADGSREILPGRARVVRDGLGRTGVYRDETGTLHAVSLRCTHLGCLLRFNEAERSWDCPCHGSRFDVDGAVLEGPATTPLARRDPGQSKQD